jgi:hypothetical protein
MALGVYSTSNLTNSVAEYLAESLLELGYLVHWMGIDALQTPAAVYPRFRAGEGQALGLSAVAQVFANSRGIITIRDDDFSFPQYPVRPTSDGFAVALEDVPVPTIAVSVQPGRNGRLLGLGSKKRDRYALLTLFGLARDKGEQLFLADALRETFDQSEYLPVLNHDSGTAAPAGSVEITSSAVDTDTRPLDQESQAFEVTLTATLLYQA